MRNFNKKNGATNKGIPYEDLNMANTVLKLVKNENIEDFYISANDQNFGAFDDIVVEIESKNGKEMFALQLKHNDRGNLALERLKNKNGDFSLTKYFDSFQTIKNMAQKFILFTNLKFNFRGNTRFQLEGEDFFVVISKFHPKDVFRISEETDYCYKFHIVEDSTFKDSVKIQEYKAFFHNFFLYSDQDNLDLMRIKTAQKFKDMFLSDETEFDTYLKLISDWGKEKGCKEMLDKKWMRRAIALILLSSRIKSLAVFPNINEKIKILREAISSFDLTIIEKDSCDLVKYLWCDVRNKITDIKEINRLRMKYQLSIMYISNWNDVDDILATKLLWLMGKCPLIVTEDATVEKAIELCFGEKIVLFGNGLNEKCKEEKSVFYQLADLKRFPSIYDKLMKNFSYSVQEKGRSTLEDLRRENEEFVESVKVHTLLEMLGGPLNIGGKKEVLPIPYLQRFLLKNAIDVKYLEKPDINALVIIYCVTEDFQNNFNQHNFIDVDNLLNDRVNVKDKNNLFPNFELLSDNCTEGKNLKRSSIYVSKNDYSDDYRLKLCNKIKWTKNCHQFRNREDRNLEWIQSNEAIGELKRYQLSKCYFVEEKSLWNLQLPNNVNLIISDPGMGKTELLKSFKNNSLLNFWTVIINPEDVQKFCQNMTQISNASESFEKFILEVKHKDLCDFDQEFLKVIMKEKIIFVWDALDEISNEHLEKVLPIISQFSKRSFFQMVTSRCHLKTKLEIEFNVMALNLNKLSEEEQAFYIEQRLRDFSSQEKIDEITKKIKTTFALVEHKDILGIPLQIFMLTELFREDLDKYSEVLNNTFALTDLYYYFIEEKFNIYFKKNKIFTNPQNPEAEKLSKFFKNEILKCYEKLALKILFSSETLDQMKIDGDIEIVSKTSVGLVTEAADETPRFLHLSFAEYFAALYFSRNLTLKNIFMKIIFDQRNVNVRFFFDLLLDKDSPLHIALLYKNYDVLKTESEIIRGCKDKGGRSLLHIACSWGRRYPRLKVKKKLYGYFIDDNKNFYANEEEEYLNLLNSLLEDGPISEDDALFGLTPLKYAQKCDCLMVALKTIRKQDKNILDICDETDAINILYYSAKFGYDDALDCFKSNSIPLLIREKEKVSLLHVAIPHNNYKYVSKLLNNKIYKNRINVRSKRGRTPLMEASYKGYEKIVKLLVESGAEVNLVDNHGETSLHKASKSGHTQIVKFLIASGANVNTCSINKHASLHIACLYGREEIVKILISSGAKINNDFWNTTPLHYACRDGYKKIAEILVASGAEINRAPVYYATPLHEACNKGRGEIVKMLISSGANINFHHALWGTPLYLASMAGHEKTVEILSASGAETNLSVVGPLLPNTEETRKMLSSLDVGTQHSNKNKCVIS